MKNFGMNGRQHNTGKFTAPRARAAQSLGRGGERIRKRIAAEPLFRLVFRLKKRALFVENGRADHANVARAVIFLVSVGFVHRTEAKRGHSVAALPKRTARHCGSLLQRPPASKIDPVNSS
jgi:hypothetical protein